MLITASSAARRDDRKQSVSTHRRTKTLLLGSRTRYTERRGMSQPRSSDEAAADHLVSMLGDLRHKIHLVESKQLQAEAALEGCGHYLGTEGHDTLFASLESLRSKEEYLREEKLILLRAASSAESSGPHVVRNPDGLHASTQGNNEPDSPELLDGDKKLTIYIRSYPTGRTTVINHVPGRNCTVGKLTEEYEAIAALLVHHHRSYFVNGELVSTDSLDRYIQDRGTIIAYTVPMKTIEINVLDVVGCKAVVSGIFPDSMVQELKQAYHLMRGITVDNQMLVFQGRQLQSDKNLSSYGIEHDSTIIIRETIKIYIQLDGTQAEDGQLDPSNSVLINTLFPNSTVMDLKQELRRIRFVAVEAQTLTFNGAPLSDDHTMSQHSIINGSVVTANVVSMTIFVRRLRGKLTTLAVHFRNTVEEVKYLIRDKESIPPEEQRLLFSGRQLADRDTLFDYNVEKDSTLILTLRLRGGKPVIMLCPTTPLDAVVTVKLSPAWRFSAVYPKPLGTGLCKPWRSQGITGGLRSEWRVHASPDGTLTDLGTRKEYPYLFWEADSEDSRLVASFGLDKTKSFCIAGSVAGKFLDNVLKRLGLNSRERCDMITFWLHQLESYPFNVVYFVDVDRYEKAARLSIHPTPDVIIRVFITFRGIDVYDKGLDTAKVDDMIAPTRKGFVAVEWGGMNLNGADDN